MSRKIPKALKEHRAVEEVRLGEDSALDYKYDVFLKEGYVFKYGRMAGIRTGHFDSVKDFLHACPYKPITKKAA